MSQKRIKRKPVEHPLCPHTGFIYTTCCEAHRKNPELAEQCEACAYCKEIDACVRDIAPCRHKLERMLGEPKENQA